MKNSFKVFTTLYMYQSVVHILFLASYSYLNYAYHVQYINHKIAMPISQGMYN